jgi:hypothetical protein
MDEWSRPVLYTSYCVVIQVISPFPRCVKYCTVVRKTGYGRLDFIRCGSHRLSGVVHWLGGDSIGSLPVWWLRIAPPV